MVLFYQPANCTTILMYQYGPSVCRMSLKLDIDVPANRSKFHGEAHAEHSPGPNAEQERTILHYNNSLVPTPFSRCNNIRFSRDMTQLGHATTRHDPIGSRNKIRFSHDMTLLGHVARKSDFVTLIVSCREII